MDLTNAILNYRRFIKRKNYSAYTVKNYMSTLRQFILWIDTPVESDAMRTNPSAKTSENMWLLLLNIGSAR